MLSQARQPRAAVRIAGQDVTGWIEAEVDNNVFRSADTFSAIFAVSKLPSARDAAWMATQTSIEVEIFASADPGDPDNYQPSDADRLILGAVDDLTFDPVATTITVSGRDLTALLIDTKTSEHFLNQTASQVVTTIAGRHGLTPMVTATKTRVGDYFKSDHADVTQQQSEWELLTKLAEYEDFVVFVRGRELHFEPKPSGAKTYPIKWTPPGGETAAPNAPVIELKFTRSLTIVKGLKVEVHSWNSKQKHAFTASWPAAPKRQRAGTAGPAASDATLYSYTVAGLTQDQALKIAQSRYAQLAQHAMKLSGEMPADNVLDCTTALQVSGTGTAFDQTYYPTSIKRSVSVGSGYVMEIDAQNLSPELEQN